MSVEVTNPQLYVPLISSLLNTGDVYTAIQMHIASCSSDSFIAKIKKLFFGIVTQLHYVKDKHPLQLSPLDKAYFTVHSYHNKHGFKYVKETVTKTDVIAFVNDICYLASRRLDFDFNIITYTHDDDILILDVHAKYVDKKFHVTCKATKSWGDDDYLMPCTIEKDVTSENMIKVCGKQLPGRRRYLPHYFNIKKLQNSLQALINNIL